MKKLLKTGKKALSVFLAVLMVLTAWVWVAPQKAEAAAGSYYVKITWKCTDAGDDYDVAYSGFANKTKGNCAGISLYYKSNNGTGTESEKYWDFQTRMKTKGTYTEADTISGFPTYLFVYNDAGAITDQAVYEITKIEIGASSTSTLTTLWSGSVYMNSTNQIKSVKLLSDGTGSESTDNTNAKVTTSSINWVYPYAKTFTWSPENLSAMTCPKTASDVSATQTVSVTAKDQYGVQMFDPTWKVSGNVKSTGITVSPTTSSGSTTISVNSSANILNTTNSQTGTVTATWSTPNSTGNTSKTSSKNFTINDATYTATFKNHRDADGLLQNEYTTTAQYGVPPTPPSASDYSEGDYDYTFNGWSPSVTGISADTTYIAGYSQSDKILADYTAVNEAIAAANAIKTQYGTEYELKFTLASRTALDTAINAVVTGLGRTQQNTVDSYANAIKDALNLKPNKFAVIFLDKNGAIIKYEKDAEYKSVVKAPDFPEEQKNYHDATNHYEYSGWDTDEYNSVIDDLVIAPVYTAEAHDWKIETVTSTCVQAGTQKYTCKVCGYVKFDGGDELGDHVWRADYTVDVKPTCVLPGSKSIHCTLCDAQKDITEIAPNGHTWGDFAVAVNPTCTNIGISTRVCAEVDCKFCEHLVIDALEHDYKKTTVAPTCTTKGYDEYVCQRENCGHSYRDNYTDIIAHTYGAWETVSEAHCGVAGVKKQICTANGCGYINLDSISALEHDKFDDIEWVVIVPATCEYAGYKTKTCSKCGNVIKAETIDALTHDLETTTTPATCTTAGTTVVSCKRENCAYETTTITQPLTHNWNNGVEKKADCTHSAYTLYTCQRADCGETKIEVKDESAPALGHDFSGEGVTTPATCTSGAYITYTCQREGCKETKVVVPENSAALGHDFSGTESNVVDATCTEDGSKTVKCIRCDETTTVILPRLGHSYGEWDKTTNPATNDKDGTWTRTCTKCGDVETLTIPKGGHTFEEDAAQYVAPKCNEKGQRVYKCTAHADCIASVTVVLDYAQHSITTDNKAASCTESGWSKTSCSVCNKEFNSVEIPATGHNYEASVKTPASCTSAGVMLYTCKNDAKHTYEASIPALAHDYTVTETAATCEAAGTKTYDCKNCDALHVEIVEAALGHAWTSTTHAATCTTTSYIEHKCGNDSSHNFVQYVVGSQLAAHNYVEVEGSRKAADCENNGSVEYKCSVCQDEKKEILPRLGHAYGEWDKTTDPATNDKDGKWTRTCVKCTDVETLTIPKGNHNLELDEDESSSATCSKKGLEVYKCTNHENCSVTVSVVLDELQHTIAQKVTDATCTAKGWVESYCSVCDTECKKPFSTTEIPVIPHTYEEKSKEDATCTTSGYTVMACKCGASYNRYDADTPATGHDFTGDETIVDSTCTVNGSKTVQCSNCTETYTTTLPLANHKYVADGAAVPATCTAPATQNYKCDYCNIGYTEYVSAANGHKWSDNWTLVREATDNEYGVEKTTCTVAGCDAEQFRTTPPTGAHSFTKVSETPATCTSEGSIEWNCETHENCEANYTETLNKLPHTQTIEYNAPTCVAEGSSKVVCSVEGCRAEILSSTIPVIIYHNFSGNGVITTEASCEGTGIMTYTCLTDGCNATKTEVIPAKGHTFETTVTDATCENPGSVVTFCSTCNDAKHTTTVELTKKNHAWNDGEIKKGDAATCEGTGKKTFTCSACNATKTETIPATGHSWSDWTKTDATSTTDGKWTRTCSTCNIPETLTIPRGHSLVRDDENSTAASCTAEGKEIYICEGHTDCGVKIEVTLPMLQHNYTTEYVDSTCDRAGYIRTSCTVCNKFIVDKIISPKAHTFDKGTKYPATCTDAAYHLYQCINTDAQGNDNCNYSYKAFAGGTDAAIGHNLVAGVTFATCEGTGSQIFYCDRENCGYSTSVEMPALGHNYEAQGDVVSATCTAPATQVYKCTACNAAYTKLVEAEKGHSFGNWTVTQDATTDKFGIQERSCSVCGYVEYDKIAPIGNHVFKEEILSSATCTTDGMISYTCTVATHGTCSANYTKTIPATGHTEAFAYEAATCSKGGFAKMYCSTCTTVLSEQKIDKLGCDWVQGEVTAATCNNVGSIAYKCSRCQAEKSVELPVNEYAHQYETKVTDATCYREGSVVTMCKLCKNKLSEETLIKTEHTWDDGTETTPATCTTKGEKTYKCTVDGCNAEKTEAIDALGHNWDNWFVESASTNSTEGVMKRVCKSCNASETHTIPAGGHEWDDGKVTKEATCTSTGTKVYACKKHTGDNACGITFTVTLDKLQHELTTSKTDATCLDDGKVITKCKKCDTTTITTTIPATGHTYNDGVKTPATCTSEGKLVYTCTNANCGVTRTVTLDKLQHVYVQQGDAVAPTCTSSGYTNYKCKTCTSSYAVIGASSTGHKFDDSIEANVTVVPSTCNTEGTKTVKCAYCGVTNTVKLPKSGHNYIKQGETVSATCKTPATETYKCEFCNDNYVEYVSDKLAEHTNWSAWTKVDATESSLGYQTRVCNTCGQVEFKIIPATGEHNFNDETTDKRDATCTEDGYIVYACSTDHNCGLTSKVTIPATGHNGKLSYSAATCTGEGSTKIVCETCKKTIGDVETIPALGHLFNGTGVYIPATCVAEGSMTYTCSRKDCDATHSTKIAVDPDAHNLKRDSKAASCKEEGYVNVSCENGCKYKEETTLPKLQHSWGEWSTVKASTNDSVGLMKRTCANGCTEEVEIPAGGHTLTEVARTNSTCTVPGFVIYGCKVNHTGNVSCGIQVKVNLPLAQHTVKTEVIDASCTSEGTIKTSCSECKAKLAEDIKLSKLQHKYAEGAYVEPTCTSSGYTPYTCSCGDTYNKLGADALGHSWTPWTVSKAPTADTEGESVRTCLREGCSVVETLTIPALGESVSFTVNFVVEGKLISTQKVSYGSAATAPKVAVKAPDADYHYSFSWDTDFAEVTADLTVNGIYTATGHTYGEWITDRPADCNNSGLRHRVCACEYIDEDVVAKLSHDLSEVVKEQPATCTENGYKVVVCKNCGTTETKTLNRLGHSMVYYEGYEATCDTEGSARHYNCTRCGKNFENREGTAELITTVIAKRHHTFVVVDGTTATCTSAGVTDYKFCTICGFVQHSETIPALGHADTDRNNRCDRCGILYENNGAKICSCNCHKTGMINEIFYKILLFFWKLFGVSKSCGCGTVHY